MWSALLRMSVLPRELCRRAKSRPSPPAWGEREGPGAGSAGRVRRVVPPVWSAGFPTSPRPSPPPRPPRAERVMSRSAPELPGGAPGALDEGLELRPRDLRMDAAAETAIGRRNDPLPPDQPRKAHDPIGDELGVFDDIRRMADDARHDQFAVGQFDVPPHLPFMRMAHIAGLERVGAGLDRQHYIDDVAQWEVR